MRLARIFHPLSLLLTVAACGSSPASHASTPADEPASGGGATAKQPNDDRANRPLTESECQQLGQSIVDTCHATNSRMATIEGWCRDVVVGVGSGSWVTDCQKHIKYVDAVCFSSTDSAKSMMDCDSTVSR